MEQKEAKKLIEKYHRDNLRWPRCIGCGEEVKDIPCDVSIWKKQTMFLCPTCKEVEFPHA